MNLKKLYFAWRNLSRHGEMSFLHQWVSATSPGSDETALLRQAEFFSPWRSSLVLIFQLSGTLRHSARQYFAWQNRHGHLCGEVAWSSLELLAF
jgi:hypothetical protein